MNPNDKKWLLEHDERIAKENRDKLAKAHEILEIQGQSGNWNYDPYMHGIYNGMELILATLEGRDPNYRGAPKKWLYKLKAKGGTVATPPQPEKGK